MLDVAARGAALCALALICLAPFSLCQQHIPVPALPNSSDSSDSNRPMMPSEDGPMAPIDGVSTASPFIPAGAETAMLVSAEACNSWTESGVRSPTVSVARLEIPTKASDEYQKACGAYKDKKLTSAEDHVRRAIDLYPNYAAAWVVLGQVLNAEKKRDDAQKACEKAEVVDPNYVAPYLCLAEFAVTEDDWDRVSKFSEQALALDPVSNPYSLYYSADCALHLQHLPEAEKNALAAIQLDTWHHMPQLHLLLAQIYDAKSDPVAEAAQLKEYLKQAPNSSDAAGAKSTLAALQRVHGTDSHAAK
jgi:hypothetical protein